MSDVRANAGVPVLAQFCGVATPSACAPLVVDTATGYIYSWKTGDVIFAAGAGGTVTSVGGSFTGGLISVAGSPITASGTLALTVAGTSGGIPYFSGAATWASSALLTANGVMIGGGAATTPSTIAVGTNNQVLRGNTGAAPAFGTITLASADFVNQGTATTVLHGNAAGNPSFGAVSLTADVSGILPTANGGTGIAYFTAAGPTQARIYTFPDAAATMLYSGGALGTPSSGTATNLTGTAAGLTAGTVTTNANLTGQVTSVGNATTLNMSPITASLSGDVTLNNTANYFDGPSVAQGTTGTWFVSGTVTVVDSAGIAAIYAKLWDGTTLIATGYTTCVSAGNGASISLSGFLATPAGNLRISVRDASSTSGAIKANSSGLSKDSTITAIRIA